MLYRRWVLAVLMCSAVYAEPAFPQVDLVGKVISIQDGDTLTLLDLELAQHRIRVAGIDAPEKGQPFGNVAATQLGSLAFNKLANARCHKVDQYGREVCTVVVDGKDIGLAQMRAGFAWHYKQFANEQNASDRDQYATAEDRAREFRLGLWAESRPIAPWDWRRGARSWVGSTERMPAQLLYQ